MDRRSLGALLLCMVLAFVVSFLFLGPRNNTEVVNPSEDSNQNQQALDVGFSAESITKNPEKEFTFETDLFKITFNTKGASISSMMLKKHANADGQGADIIFKGEDSENAFLLYWKDDIEKPILDNFSYEIVGQKVIFKNTFKDKQGNVFTIVKTYEFKDGEYLFAFDVDIDGKPATGEYSCTVGFGPQVGPNFTEMKNNNYDYRRFYAGVEKKNGKVKANSVKLTNNYFSSTRYFQWFSLTSKYFTVIARPENFSSVFKYQAKQTTGGSVAQTDSFYISIPDYAMEDGERIYFYCGPQLKSSLGSYYSGTDNAWGLKGYNLDDAMESGSMLGWLENILKWCLQLLYKICRNYGVAIILLTILIKLAMWPLQKKSSISTARMSAIAPKVEEIKKKYPDNPQKQNTEVTKLYKENGVKPLGGCLPLLLQFPILIAFYGLLNRHIELRGAMFIPGWMPDLSLPDHVVTLGFKIPLLGNEIHLLPVIYTASMIFSMKYTQAQNQNQTTDPSQKTSMFMMTWLMPIFFFFVLYNAPSGLLLYWTTQNGLSILQQFITNKKIASGAYLLKEKQEIKPEAIRKYEERMKKIEQMRLESEKRMEARRKKK